MVSPKVSDFLTANSLIVNGSISHLRLTWKASCFANFFASFIEEKKTEWLCLLPDLVEWLLWWPHYRHHLTLGQHYCLRVVSGLRKGNGRAVCHSRNPSWPGKLRSGRCPLNPPSSWQLSFLHCNSDELLKFHLIKIFRCLTRSNFILMGDEFVRYDTKNERESIWNLTCLLKFWKYHS